MLGVYVFDHDATMADFKIPVSSPRLLDFRRRQERGAAASKGARACRDDLLIDEQLRKSEQAFER